MPQKIIKYGYPVTGPYLKYASKIAGVKVCPGGSRHWLIRCAQKGCKAKFNIAGYRARGQKYCQKHYGKRWKGRLMKGPILRYRRHVIGVVDSENGACLWQLRCSTKNCKEPVNFANFYRKKIRKCQSCKDKAFFGISRAGTRKIAKLIKRVEQNKKGNGSGWTRYYGICAKRGCRAEYQLFPHAPKRCSPYCKLHRAKAVILGIPCNIDKVIARRHKIVAVGKKMIRNKNGTLTSCRTWMAKCEQDGCDNLYVVNDYRKKERTQPKCVHCYQRKLPYYSKWKRLRADSGKKIARYILFLLTYKQWVRLCKIPNCHYCGKALKRNKYTARHEGGSNGTLLDRKDSTKPYQVGNCVPCCASCNRLKHHWLTYEEMMVIAAMRRREATKAAALLRKATKKGSRYRPRAPGKMGRPLVCKREAR